MNPAFSDTAQPEQPTGTCPECWGTEIPLAEQVLTEHQSRRVRLGADGRSEHYVGDDRCDGSGAKPLKGTSTRPHLQRGYRGQIAGSDLRAKAASQESA